MTATVVEPTVETSTPVITLPEPQSLYRAVSNALLFTIGAKEHIPALRAVRFERDLDGTLTLVACDRYRLFTETVENTMEGWKGQLQFLLACDDAKRLADVLKGAGRIGEVTLTVDDTRMTVRAGAVDISLGFEQEATFPQWRNLLPKEDDASDVGGIALNPAHLGHISKLKLASGGPAQFKFYGANKPSQISFNDGPVIWQMPVISR
ncbi:hypothetical protein [Streptomyces sp. MMBL 11-1]|uniref:hypothetical protein n=1 Tax=Streptomyces sp. MMBL 11-1 TaxID=3026420 RepID=UPI00235DD005|nr:hypothetical protein [Streptomyces sp. MMBL 11-1]